MGLGEVVCRWYSLKGWSKGGAGSVQNAYILRMKRGEIRFQSIWIRLVSIESFGEFFRQVNFGFPVLPKSSARHSLFQISTFQFFITTCGELLLGVRRAPGSRAQLLCRLVCKFKRFCRTIFAPNRTTTDSHDAYYFGNVDKISTPAARLRARITTAKIPQSTQNTFIFSGFHS